MYRKIFYPLFLLAIGYLLLINNDAQTIIAGIAIFLIGMVFMEDGFKLFSGGLLEKILAKSTSNIPKSIGTGFVATAIVQSSSLISIIVISFLSAEIISLSGAVGVVFGSNIGTTTTAWIVSTFGVKIKIAHYAMPMLIFGVIFKFSNKTSLQGLGNILVGLGFVFLGIGYMKEGFETLKNGIDLASYAIDGYLGVLVYILLGAIATIIIQSSSATVALIITALATGQIDYINGLELAIGANIGTTVTAIIGAMTSNSNGKRLAVAHFVFNIITGTIAIIFLYPLASLVDTMSVYIGIGEKDYAMKLALFHTIFNIIGVITVSPFTHKLVKFLKTLFIENEHKIDRAKYLDDVVIKVPQTAIISIEKEIEHLYDNASQILSHSLSLHRDDYYEKENILDIVKKSDEIIDIDIDAEYQTSIKELYGDIIKYSSLAQENMDKDDMKKIYNYEIASKDIVESLKEAQELQKNINKYITSDNNFIKKEYNFLREKIAFILNRINNIRNQANDIDSLTKIELLKVDIKDIDIIKNGTIDKLIRDNFISTKMATSLINDATFTYNISKKLINIASILWIKDNDILELTQEKI